MSKTIRITPEYAEKMRAEFEQALAHGRVADGRFSFTHTFGNTNEKATLLFTAEAWMKMWLLIQEFSKEVAWHGVAHRVESEDKHEYLISDIVVYPQEVTGATVEMDTEKYTTWLMENWEDERFAHLHMQGHSHVNMGVTPSGTDLNHQREILDQLPEDGFYIFMIYNKSMKRNIKIYDFAKNILFEDGDVSVGFLGGVENMDAFLKDAKASVKDRQYNSGSYYNSGYGSSYGTGYGNGRGTTPATTSTPYNPVSSTQKDTKSNVTPISSGVKTEEKKEEEKPKTKIGAGWAGKNASSDQTSLYPYYDEDDLPPYYDN